MPLKSCLVKEMSSTEEAEKKLLYRLERIIPRNLVFLAHSLTVQHHPIKDLQINNDGPQEVFFQMTWGKIAGK